MLSFQFHLDLIALGKLSYEQNMDRVVYDSLLCQMKYLYSTFTIETFPSLYIL